MLTPAQIAAQEFRRRQNWLSQQVNSGRMDLADANTKLRPWLAIAARAGADLPGLWEQALVLVPENRAGALEHIRVIPNDIAPKEEALSALAKARDAAIDLITDNPPTDLEAAKRAATNAQNLAALAWALRAPPYHLPEGFGSTAQPAKAAA